MNNIWNNRLPRIISFHRIIAPCYYLRKYGKYWVVNWITELLCCIVFILSCILQGFAKFSVFVFSRYVIHVLVLPRHDRLPFGASCLTASQCASACKNEIVVVVVVSWIYRKKTKNQMCRPVIFSGRKTTTTKGKNDKAAISPCFRGLSSWPLGHAHCIHLSAGRSTHTHNVYLHVTYNVYVSYSS